MGINTIGMCNRTSLTTLSCPLLKSFCKLRQDRPTRKLLEWRNEAIAELLWRMKYSKRQNQLALTTPSTAPPSAPASASLDMAFETDRPHHAVPADAVGHVVPCAARESMARNCPTAAGARAHHRRHSGTSGGGPHLRPTASNDGSIAPTVLTDGRLAYRCLWQADLAAAFDAGQIAGAEELTEQQLAELTPEPEAV